MKRFYASLTALVILTCGILPATGFAQAKKTTLKTAPAVAANDPLTSLPDSDGVISVDVQRLLNDVLPSVLKDDQARLAEVNAKIDAVKTRTGIDVRAFERAAIGMRFVNSTPDKLAVESVVLARGRFNAQTMLNAGLLAMKEKHKYAEQKYGGKTIYVFDADELFGVYQQTVITAGTGESSGSKPVRVAQDNIQKILNFKGEFGVVALDTNTLAFGQLSRVRAAIDAAAGRGRVGAALTQLATRDPNAVIGFGANAPSNVSKYFGLDATDDIAKTLDTIRQVYGSVNSSAGGGFEMQTFARTDNAAQAQDVYNTLAGFRDLGGFFASNLSGDKGKLAQTALDNLKITKEANEVQIRLALAQADVAMLVRVFDKRN